MSANLLLYTLCLLANTPILLSARAKVWSNQLPIEISSSYESLEILPHTFSKLADRTNIMTEKIEEHDKHKLLTLLTDTKKEVKDAEAFLSEMLRVLQNIFAMPQQKNDKQTSIQNNGQNIAWSYYDDIGK